MKENGEPILDALQVLSDLHLALMKYEEKQISFLEVADFANEIGIVIAKQCTHKQMQNDFIMGFKHGVALASSSAQDRKGN